MKAVFCLVFVALVASTSADPIAVSEAKLAIQSNSDLLTSGNGLYHPVKVENVEVKEVVVPVSEVIVEEPVRQVLYDRGIQRVLIEVD